MTEPKRPPMTRQEFALNPSTCMYPPRHPACYEHGRGPGPALCKAHAQDAFDKRSERTSDA